MIKRLRLKGFRRYVDETFELGSGVTFIDGRNNAGKTTLFLAIEYALTGTVAGARSQAVLLRPGAKGLGVELVFTGRDGNTYKLQRLHQLPPRSRSKLVGHFTLKQIVADDDERYLLSSDFQDHEDLLAKKLAEITGITRRVLDLAVHVRQGEIARILDGDPRLDIVLGITAAGTANEEMRALALEDEQAAEALPALEASLGHLDRERTVASSDESELRERLAKARAEAEQLAAAADNDEDADEEFARLSGAVIAWRAARDRVASAESQLQVGGSGPELELRHDLRARIRRREETLRGTSTCESCGAQIEQARAERELAAWQAELRELDARLLEQAARELDPLRRAVAIAEAAARKLAGGDARALDVVEAERRAELERKRVERAAARARAEARLEHLTATIDEIEDRLAAQAARGGELDREHTRVGEHVERLRKRRRRAEDFRALAAAFKQLQEQLRTRAASELAASTLAIHKALSVEHEIVDVTVDPTRYQVLVTPKDTGQSMPASLAQGGGHRLLLGLAFRLALVQRLGPFPFVLLDEPTYGLDEQHRLALLERIAGLGLCEQILLITHQAMGKAPGQRIVVDKAVAA